MAITRPMVAGVDIGSREHWVAGPPLEDGTANVRVFGTTTPQLEELANWLTGQGLESVAMESTSVYWIPLYEILESVGLEVVLVNARQLHNVPGRKTDMADCQWLQVLHSCGLLRGSFRPHESICRLRAIHRQMANLRASNRRHVQWMQKSLDQMNVQVHHAVTDITGKTGMRIVRAIVAGERDARTLARLRDRRCKKSEEKIAEHLSGNWRAEHLFNLESSLRLYDAMSEEIVRYEQRLQAELEAITPIERSESPVPAHPNRSKATLLRSRGGEATRKQLWRLAGVDLTRIDGINATTAKLIVTEVGVDLSRFPSERHFVSWLRLSPRTRISGGKPLKKKRNGLGATRIANTLRVAAQTFARSKTALGAAYRRISRHKGAPVAVFAIARKLATYVFRMLRYGTDYVDIGAERYEERYKDRRLAGLQRAATEMGFALTPTTETTA